MVNTKSSSRKVAFRRPYHLSLDSSQRTLTHNSRHSFKDRCSNDQVEVCLQNVTLERFHWTFDDHASKQHQIERSKRRFTQHATRFNPTALEEAGTLNGALCHQAVATEQLLIPAGGRDATGVHTPRHQVTTPARRLLKAHPPVRRHGL